MARKKYKPFNIGDLIEVRKEPDFGFTCWQGSQNKRIYVKNFELKNRKAIFLGIKPCFANSVFFVDKCFPNDKTMVTCHFRVKLMVNGMVVSLLISRYNLVFQYFKLVRALNI